MRADLAEIAALKKEVVRLRAERDILKKDETIFCRWFKDNGRTLFSRARRGPFRATLQDDGRKGFPELPGKSEGRCPICLAWEEFDALLYLANAALGKGIDQGYPQFKRSATIST